MITKSRILLIVLFISSLLAGAANFSFLSHTVKQPDGTVINCFVSGDEYFNWLHDADGYTIILGKDGFYYWGIANGDSVIASPWLVNKTVPSEIGLTKWTKISLAKYNERRAFYTQNTDQSVRAPHIGIMNNLVVYIRFNDDTEFTVTRQAYDDKFNPPTGNSLKSYFSEVSYSTFTISSTHYPECVMTTNYSYQDTHNRNYFEPYNATTNPNGYNGDSQRTQREHTLLKDAITWINANSPVPAGLDIDGDSDSRVDNVCFIIRGGNGAWAELLWAHRWALYSYTVNINGKRVYDYTFQPESQVAVKTLCHEMFHALGSPDLYHYTSNGISPAGPWDIMDGGSGSMTAYMKWDYTQHSWIASIPEITVSGTYTLHPLSSASNNCYKIASPYSPSQFFMLEYRKKSGTFEGSLPGSGLIVYRIDPVIGGNASGPPDELYVYRPGGTLATNGTTSNAFFSAGSGRIKINDESNPSSFLQNGSPGGLDISNVTAADTTISFTVKITHLDDPADLAATAISTSAITLDWQKNPAGSNVLLVYDTVDRFGIPISGKSYVPGDSVTGGGIVIFNGNDTTFNHSGLLTSTRYYYKAWSILQGTTYSTGVVCNATTYCESISVLPFAEGFENSSQRPGCWFEDNTDPAWQFVAGNGPGIATGYPATAHSGALNACLKDATTDANYNTLITPLFDLPGYSDINLKFWLYMQKWGTRQDELIIYYRADPSMPWMLLESFNQSYAVWTERTISLPAGITRFQIGFEGNARSGFGICIDDIEISGTLIATLNVSPANREVSSSAGSTTFSVICPISWTATSDTPSWCTVTPSGTGNGSITATFSENILYSKRIANIAVVASGVETQTITVTQKASSILVGELLSGNLRVYPNPANGFCWVTDENGENKIIEISIMDFTGRALLTRKGEGQKEFSFDISMLVPGSYTMKIKGENSLFIRKLIVIR